MSSYTGAGQGRPPRRRRGLRAFLGLVAVAVLAAGIYVFSLYRQVSGSIDQHISRSPLLPTQTLECRSAVSTPPTARPASARPAAAMADAGDARNFVVVRRDSNTPGKGDASAFLWTHISNDRTRIDVVTFEPELRVSPSGCPEETLRDVFQRAGTSGVVAFLGDLLQVPVDHVVEVDRQGFALMKQLLDPKVIANPVGVDDAVTEAMSHLVFDDSMNTDELRDLAFSLRDLQTTKSHTMTQPREPGAAAPAPLSASAPAVVKLRTALQQDAMAGYR